MSKLLTVSKSDQLIGFMLKKEIHQLPGVFHRAFSIFIFNKKGELLLQKRSKQKFLWPLHWTNSCCSHPEKGEEIKEAAKKRLKEELGFTCQLKFIGKLSYQACWQDKGCEKEVTHIFTGQHDGLVIPNKKEVMETKWISLNDLGKAIEKQPQKYSPWLKKIIKKFKKELKFNSKKTTDDPSEVFEIVDLKGRIIGKAKRGEVHRNKKLIHKAVGLILKDKKGKILLQKRSSTKDLYPGLWTVSISGHIDVNERKENAIVRETKEELGIKLNPKNLKKLGQLLIKAPQETELLEMFSSLFDEKQKFFLNKQEVEKTLWLTEKEFFLRISQGKIKLTPSADCFFSNRKMINKVFKAKDEED